MKKKKNDLKKIVPVGIIIILILLGAMAFFGFQNGKNNSKKPAQNNVTTDKDTKTYQNYQHNISFEYPTGWEFSVTSEREDYLSINLRKQDVLQEKIIVYEKEMIPSYEINIIVEDNKKHLSAKDFYLEQFSQSSRQLAAEKIEEAAYNGFSGIRYPEATAPSSGPATAFLFTRNGKAYRFIYSALARKSTHEKYLDVFEDLLSSLKVTN